MKLNPLTLQEKEKARGTCNGGPRLGKAITLAKTYAACLEQPIHHLFWAISAALCMIVVGCDIANTFAEADGPATPYYMVLDPPFRDWWEKHLKQPLLPKDYVVPIRKNLQGHPKAPRLWSQHIDDIMLLFVQPIFCSVYPFSMTKMKLGVNPLKLDKNICALIRQGKK